MHLIKAFAGLRPQKKYAKQVVAPPYDVLNRLEAKALAQGNPYSFLHISKAEIDLPDSVNPYDDRVYQKAAENFKHFLKQNILFSEQKAAYYIYKITTPTQSQTGLVAAASVKAYLSGQIKKHELTRPEKENDRIRQIKALAAQTGPVMLAFHEQASSVDLLNNLSQKNPDTAVLDPQNNLHELWVISDEAKIVAIDQAFSQVKNLYIADGHHRCAAAAKIALEKKLTDETANYFLSVIFPASQLQILSYHRLIKSLNYLTNEKFLDLLTESFLISPTVKPETPAKLGDFLLYIDTTWYDLKIKPELIDQTDPTSQLDADLLNDYVLAPILDIVDIRRDERIDFVGGQRGLVELKKRVDSGEMCAAFALAPASIQTLFAVANRDEIMPPKSTWFEPKLLDGLVSYRLT